MAFTRVLALGWLGLGLAFVIPKPTGSQAFFRVAPQLRHFAEAGTGKGLSGPQEPSGVQKEQSLKLEVEDADRFAMVYTCGQCQNRNLAAVSKVAYQEGLVIVTCQHCGAKHLVADNKGLMNIEGFDSTIEEYLKSKGETAKIRTSLPDGVSMTTTEEGTVEVVSAGSAAGAPKAKPSKEPAAVRRASSEPRGFGGSGGSSGSSTAAKPSSGKATSGPAKIKTIPTKPIAGQKPGTSGLRKKVKVWQEGSYLDNFVQAMLDAWEGGTPASLVLGGDGRYFSDTAIARILQICAANGVKDVHVGQHGVLSTPAVSGLIRSLKTDGGVVLTASHNPGGPDEDFGIKFNNKNGAPAPESATDKVFQATESISTIRALEGAAEVDLGALGTVKLGDMDVHVVDSVEGYVAILEEQFDFAKLRSFAESHPDFTLSFDAMHGAAGPYAERIFKDKLGMAQAECLRCNPLPDFGGTHPDPNLFYAADLVAKMGLKADGTVDAEVASADVPDLGAASDGDGDRNMILGKGCFVTPSDSLAVIADWADVAIPGIQRRGGLRTVARSMPTSGAVDEVAKKKGMRMFATPTGWKFFGNLMDSALLGGDDLTPLLCGEESFGTGSDHVREKDGVWAVLAWLSILAAANDEASSPFESMVSSGQLVGVKEVLERHWATYGRHLYSRWDFENVGSDGATDMVERLRGLEISDVASSDGRDAEASPRAEVEADAFGELLDLVNGGEGGAAGPPAAESAGLRLVNIDDFAYVDPVDGSEAKRQGLVMSFEGGVSPELGGTSRAVVRLSGTGSSGATVRLYLELYDSSGFSSSVDKSAPQLLEPLAQEAMRIMQMKDFTGVEKPTVIT